MAKNSLKMVKKALCLIFAFLLSIESFGAIVSSSDGGAFVTKAEFEALKEDFNTQLDIYNKSIDNKIDGAIANYLGGIRIGSYQIVPAVISGTTDGWTIIFNNSNQLNYKFGWPRIQLDVTQARLINNQNKNHAVVRVVCNPIDISDATRITKTTITGLTNYGGVWSAAYEGYRIDCDDLIALYVNSPENDYTDANSSIIEGFNWTKQGSGNSKVIDSDLNGRSLGLVLRTTNGTDLNQGTSPIFTTPIVQAIKHDWGTNTYPQAICWQPYAYDMFSNKDRDYNLGYNGTYMTSFDGWTNQRWTNATDHVNNWLPKTTMTPSLWWSYAPNTTTTPTSGSKTIAFNQWFSASHGTKPGTAYVPMIGFERTYLTNWNQIYQKNTSDMAEFDIANYSSSITGSIITTPTHSYLALSAGLPIAKLDVGESLEDISVEFNDKTKDYIIWVSERPFPSNVDPRNASNLVTLNRLDKITGLNGYKVEKGKGSFSYTSIDEKAKYLYIKWGTLTGSTTCSCEGEIKLGDDYKTKKSG